MRTDGDMIITEVDQGRGGLVGMDLTPLRGQTMLDLQRALVARLGDLRSSEVAYRADGAQEVVVQLEGEGAITVLEVVMDVDVHGGHRWQLRVRPTS